MTALFLMCTKLQAQLPYIQNTEPTSGNIVSQQFQGFSEVVSAFAADDFTVPAGETYSIGFIEVNGSYGAGSGATNVDVIIYADSGGVPGAVACSYTSISPNTDADGDLGFELPSNCELEAGTYWLSVVMAEDEASPVTWFWEPNASIEGSGFAWISPGGVLTDCVTWTANAPVNCSNLNLSDDAYDLGFALYPALGCDLAELSVQTTCSETFEYEIELNFSGTGTYNVFDNDGLAAEAVSSGNITIGPYTGSASQNISVEEITDSSCVLASEVVAPDCACAGSSAQTFDYDDCGSAASVSEGENGFFSNACAGAANDDPSNASCFEDSEISSSVWFSFIGDGGNYRIAVNNCTGSNSGGGNPLTDSQIAIYTGTCGDLSLESCNEDISAINTLSSTTLNTNEGTEYLILVDAFGESAGGEFCLDIEDIGGFISNNSCDSATPLDICENVGLSNVGADGNDDPAMSCAKQDDPVQAGVWFSFEATAPNMTVSTACSEVGSLLDTQLIVLDACEGEEIGCGEDGDQPLAEVELQSLVVGQTYYIMVDGYAGATGSFCVSITETGIVYDCSVGNITYLDEEGTEIDPAAGTITLCPGSTLTMSASGFTAPDPCLPSPGILWFYYNDVPDANLPPAEDSAFTSVLLVNQEGDPLVNEGSFDFLASGQPNDLYYLVPVIIANTEATINNNPNIVSASCFGIDPSTALAVEFLDANAAGCDSCEGFAINVEPECITDLGVNTGEANIEIIPSGNTGDIESTGDQGPYLDGNTYEICATDEIGCEACTNFTVSCPPGDICEENPISLQAEIDCLEDEFGNLTGEYEIIPEVSGGNGATTVTITPELAELGETITVCAEDEQECSECVELTMTCIAEDPCEIAPIVLEINETCLQNPLTGLQSGEASLEVTTTGGNGDVSITLNPSQEVYLDQDVVLICGLDKSGCELCQEWIVDCPPVADPCIENPLSIELDFDCITDEEDENTGEANLIIDWIGGNGVVNVDIEPEQETYQHEQIILVCLEDEEGCEICQEIEIICPPPVGDPCIDNPIVLLPTVECELDSLGNNTGAGTLIIETVGGNGGVMVGPDTVIWAVDGEEVEITAIDDLDCEVTEIVTVSCPVVVDPCEENPLILDYIAGCSLNQFGNFTGKIELTLSATGGSGDYEFEPAEFSSNYETGDVIEISVTDSLGCTASLSLEFTEECITECPFNDCAATELDWLQELVTSDLWGECYCTLQQINLDDGVYFYSIPDGGGFCPADLPAVLYDCSGNVVCADGFIPIEESCIGQGYTWDIEDPEVVQDIWTCGDEFAECGEDCSDANIELFAEYNCLEDEDGCLTGIAEVTVSYEGGTGEIVVDPAETFEANGDELVIITATDELGCSTTIELQLECEQAACSCNPVTIGEVDISCELDDDGNPTGFGILNASASGGSGNYSFDPELGSLVEHESELTVTVTDLEQDCTDTSESINVDCPPAPPCNLELSLSYECCVDDLGLQDGTGQLIAEFSGANGEVTLSGLDEGVCLSAGESYTVIATDEQGCEATSTIEIACDQESCDDTVAGTMSSSTIFACDQNLDGNSAYLDNSILGPDDTVNFILHTSSDNTLGTILGQNLTADFNFASFDAEYNTTYYLSVVVGRSLGSLVDLEHPCTDISIGAPVVFLEPLKVYDFPFCEDVLENMVDPVRVTFLLTGGLPAYDPTAFYTVSGTGYNGQQYAHMGSDNIGPIGQDQPYTLTVSDGAGCMDVIEAPEGYNCGTILAAELLDFKGQITEQGHLLEWSTASEIDTRFFLLESSSDAYSWTAMTSLDAQGDQNRGASYNWINHTPQQGMNYYRLQIVAADGTIDYSNIVQLEADYLTGFEVYPVPFSEALTVEFNKQQNGPIWISLIDFAGRTVHEHSQSAQSGHNQIQIDLADLPAGVYLLSIRDNHGQFSQKVMKQ